MRTLIILLLLYASNLLADISGTVSRVKDGDTLVISANGQYFTVRLIGVNTPESVDRRKVVECFGIEASDFLKKYVTGKVVRLEEDPTQSKVDRYQRKLGYIWLDNELVNLKIIQEGYGFEYTYRYPYKYQTRFKNAQKEAENKKKGLWADTACSKSVKIIPKLKQSSKTDQKPLIKKEKTGTIKKSRTGICHEPGTRYYLQTKNFTAYSSINDCLKNGRLPK